MDYASLAYYALLILTNHSDSQLCIETFLIFDLLTFVTEMRQCDVSDSLKV